MLKGIVQMPSYKNKVSVLTSSNKRHRSNVIGRMALDACHQTHDIKKCYRSKVILQTPSYIKNVIVHVLSKRAIRQTPLDAGIGRMSLNTGIGHKRWTQAIEQTLSNKCHHSKVIVQTISYKKTLSVTSRRSRAIRQTLLYTGIGRTPLNIGIGHSVGRKPSNKRHQTHAIGQSHRSNDIVRKNRCLKHLVVDAPSDEHHWTHAIGHSY